MSGSERDLRRLAGLAILLAAAAIVGCLGEQSASEPVPDEPKTSTPPTASFATLANVSTEHPGAEPVVDVGPEGTIYVAGKGFDRETDPSGFTYASNFRATVWRSTDGGDTWTDVSPPDTGRWSTHDTYVAAAPDGTVYAANAYGRFLTSPAPIGPTYQSTPSTFHLFRSADAGDTWERLETPQVPNPVHRMWIEPAEGGTVDVTLSTLDPSRRAIQEGPSTRPLWYLGSEDGGDTWEAPVLVHEDTSFGSALVRTPDGTLAMALWTPYQEGPDWTLMRSADGGETWQANRFGPDGTIEGFASSWHPLVAGPDGAMHLAWAQAVDGEVRLRYVSSTDGGDTWTDARSLVDVEGEAMLPWAAAAGAGALDVVWYGTAGEEDPSRWHAYHARVANATGTPTTERVHASDRAVHTGQLCESQTCAGQGSSETNPLLDFTWVTRGPEGGVHAAFASSTWDRSGSFPVYAAPGPG